MAKKCSDSCGYFGKIPRPDVFRGFVRGEISRLGLTHSAVSKAAGLSQNTLGMFLRGQGDMSLTAARSVSDVLAQMSGTPKVEQVQP